MTPTTIVVADDHPLVRRGLRAVLEAEPDLRVVGEAGDGREALQLVEQLQPNVLMLDLMMPRLNGMAALTQVTRRFPHTRVIILSMHSYESYVLQALRSGAAAYVLKEASAAELVHAVHQVIEGRRYLSPPLSALAVTAHVKTNDDATLDLYETLTGREREVLQLAAEGLSNAEIAARLSISPRTVEVHRAALMRKLGLHSPTDLIRFALRRGIVPLDT